VSTAVARALTLLTQMSPAERAKVVLSARALDKVVPLRAEMPPRDWLLAGIELELQRRGQAFPALSPSRLSDLAPSYAEDADLIRRDLESRMRKANGDDVQYVQLVSLGSTLARALAHRIETSSGGRRPVSFNSLLNSVILIPEAVEESFPGYLQSGLINMLVRERI
jgi:hypothetical protein